MFEISEKYFEKKFLVPPKIKNNIIIFLNQYLIPVPDFSEGYNNSIYFDDESLTDYQDGINGMAYRKKVRIRYYGQKEEKVLLCNLEIKEKFGSAVQKKRFRFKVKSINTTSNLFSTLKFAKTLNKDFNFDNSELLFTHFPRVQISYKRNRYICPFTGLRLNMDSEIICSKFWTNHNSEIKQNIHCNSTLLEIKGKSNPMLPKFLNKFKLKNLALSKYCYFISNINVNHNFFKFLDSSSDSERLSNWSL